MLKSKFVDKSNALGVNLANGSLSTDSPVSLDVGNGGFPYSLSASLSWHPGAPPVNPIPNWQQTTGWVPNWHNNLALSGSGMEALGASDIRGMAGAVAAFLAEQDIYKAAPSAERDVAAVLTQSWWTHQISANVATVTMGASSRQFIRTPDNAWFAPGPGFARLTMSGTRSPTNYLCPNPVHDQDPHYAQSRGWDDSGLSFAVTNQHGDVQNFGYFEYKYSTDSGFLCARQLGFRLNTWTFPQGPVVTLTYTDLEQTSPVPPGENPGFTWELTQVSNNYGRAINFDYDPSSTTLIGFDDGTGRHIVASQGGMPSTTDTLGNTTLFSYTSPIPTSATHRPVPYALLSTIVTPDQPTPPPHRIRLRQRRPGAAGEGRRSAAAVRPRPLAVLHRRRAPWQFFIADGTRGGRQDPLGGLYSVVYDTYGHGSRFIDELNRETDAI